MEEDREYNQKINLTHPRIGANIKEQDKRSYVMEQTKKAIEDTEKEFHEDEEIFEKELLDGRLISEPQTYSEVPKKRFESDFTKRFYGFSTISKDVLKKVTVPMLSDVDPQIQQGVLANAMTAFTNLHTAHEICNNNNYWLKPTEKIDTVEPRVTDMMRKTFWDLVDEDLKHDPPIYDHALIVLEDIREKLLSLLLPNNGAIRLRIEDNLDIVNIKKEIEKEEFEFEESVKFIIDCLTRLCPQSREEQVNAIKRLKKPSEIFSHVFNVLEMLKLDMSNFLISKYRPKIMEHCTTYERQNFVEYLELEYDLTRDGLHSTRQWLLRHKIEGRDTPTTVAKAFGEIITWNYQHPWPETLALDGMRLANVSRVVKRATIFGAMSISVIEMCKPLFVRHYYVIYNTLRRDLDHRFKALLPLKHMADNDLIAEDALACAEEAVRVVSKQLHSFESQLLPEDVANSLRQAVKGVLRPNNKTRSLLMMKTIQYIEESVFAESRYKVPLISGLSSIKVEVELSATEFCRIVLHNRNAYNDIYCDIIEGKLPNTTFNNNIKDHAYLHYLNKLKQTHRSSTSMAKEPLPGFTPESKPEPSKNNLKFGVPMSDIAPAKDKLPSILPSHSIVSRQIDVDILKILAPPLQDATQSSENPSVVPFNTASVQIGLNLSPAPQNGSAIQKTVQFRITPERNEQFENASKHSIIEAKDSPETSDPAPNVSKISVSENTKGSPKANSPAQNASKVSVTNISPETSDPAQEVKKISGANSNVKIVPTTSKQLSVAELVEAGEIISVAPSQGRKTSPLQLSEDDLNIPDNFGRHESASSLFNCPGSPAITWTPSASNYLYSFGIGSLSSLNDVSMDVNSNSPLPDDIDFEDDSETSTIPASESGNYINFLKKIGKYPEPMTKTTPGDVKVSPTYDNDDDTSAAGSSSFMNMSAFLTSFPHEDRLPDEDCSDYNVKLESPHQVVDVESTEVGDIPCIDLSKKEFDILRQENKWSFLEFTRTGNDELDFRYFCGNKNKYQYRIFDTGSSFCLIYTNIAKEFPCESSEIKLWKEHSESIANIEAFVFVEGYLYIKLKGNDNTLQPNQLRKIIECINMPCRMYENVTLSIYNSGRRSSSFWTVIIGLVLLCLPTILNYWTEFVLVEEEKALYFTIEESVWDNIPLIFSEIFIDFVVIMVATLSALWKGHPVTVYSILSYYGIIYLSGGRTTLAKIILGELETNPKIKFILVARSLFQETYALLVMQLLFTFIAGKSASPRRRKQSAP